LPNCSSTHFAHKFPEHLSARLLQSSNNDLHFQGVWWHVWLFQHHQNHINSRLHPVQHSLTGHRIWSRL
jgi:hypothetical protein